MRRRHVYSGVSWWVAACSQCLKVVNKRPKAYRANAWPVYSCRPSVSVSTAWAEKLSVRVIACVKNTQHRQIALTLWLRSRICWLRALYAVCECDYRPTVTLWVRKHPADFFSIKLSSLNIDRFSRLVWAVNMQKVVIKDSTALKTCRCTTLRYTCRLGV